jgi:uncharacterized OB-fold protein
MTIELMQQNTIRRHTMYRNKLAAMVCKECGERYFHAKTLDTIDQYLSAEHAVKAEMHVEVVSLG